MSLALVWIRRDLRLQDHAALHFAAKSHQELQLVFNFDPLILQKLTDKSDLRVSFIIQSLQDLEKRLQLKGASLHISYGDPLTELPRLARELKAQAVYSNRDYEPYAKERDQKVAQTLKLQGVDFFQYKDAVFFEKAEVLNSSGAVYKVFTPYKNKWLEKFRSQDLTTPSYETELSKLKPWSNPQSILQIDWHQRLGFTATSPLLTGGTSEAQKRLKDFHRRMPQYHEQRDFPAQAGTSDLSPYLRHGCISVREMIRAAVTTPSTGSEVWLSEIIWRDFYQMILDTHPYVVKESFKRDYDAIRWRGKEEWFTAWCEGRTGFPLVDAAMRCLAQTGLMHNRLRMVTASFLCKTLLHDWRKGERYFAQKLLDYDLAANNGGWQWCSSTGCDAQPYFRIFNPYNQSHKFDPHGSFIREWVPELSHLPDEEIHCPQGLLAPDYPAPIVSYERMRSEALAMYAVVKDKV